MASLAFVGGLGLICLGLGMPIVNRCDRAALLSILERCLIAFGTGALIIQLCIWGLGSYRLSASSMWGLMLICGLVALWRLVQLPWRPWAAALKLRVVRLGQNRIDLGFAFIFVALCANTLIAGLAPPADYDGLNYHLTLPKRDIEFGRILQPDAVNYINDLFPAFMGHFNRLALATVGDTAAQVFHGFFGIITAGGIYCLVRRARFGGRAGLIAGILFLSTRTIVWEAGTSHNELALSAYTILAVILIAVWIEHPRWGLAVLFGLMGAAAVYVKYLALPLAFALALSVAPRMFESKTRFYQIIVGFMLAALIFTPFMIRQYILTGNPISPLFPDIFSDDPSFRLGEHLAFGAGTVGLDRNLTGLVQSFWEAFVHPAKFDGFQLGAPVFLMFMPLVIIRWRNLKPLIPAAIVMLVYYVVWFFFLSQQVRFLIPIIPIMCVFAAVGFVAGIEALKPKRWARGLFGGVFAMALTVQAMYVGVYAMLRGPVIFGRMDIETYLTTTPSMDGAMYQSCRYLTDNLKPSEQFISFSGLHSYYCPQAAAVYNAFNDERPPIPLILAIKFDAYPKYSAAVLADKMVASNVRFVLIRFMAQAHLLKFRWGDMISPLLPALTPMFRGKNAAIYDAHEIVQALRSAAASPGMMKQPTGLDLPQSAN